MIMCIEADHVITLGEVVKIMKYDFVQLSIKQKMIKQN